MKQKDIVREYERAKGLFLSGQIHNTEDFSAIEKHIKGKGKLEYYFALGFTVARNTQEEEET